MLKNLQHINPYLMNQNEFYITKEKITKVTLVANGGELTTTELIIVEGEEKPQHVENIKDIKGNIIARWGGTCGRWDIG